MPGYWDGRGWALIGRYELYTEENLLASGYTVGEKVERNMEAAKIAYDLAEWSRKYPRDDVYSFHQKKMDDELIELEERAKALPEPPKQ